MMRKTHAVAQKQSECLLRRMPFYKFVLMWTQSHSQTKDHGHWPGNETVCTLVWEQDYMELTSPLARRVFILSRKLLSSTLDSSMMNTIFSSRHPARRSTFRKSSSKSAAKYLRWTWGSKVRCETQTVCSLW